MGSLEGGAASVRSGRLLVEGVSWGIPLPWSHGPGKKKIDLVDLVPQRLKYTPKHSNTWKKCLCKLGIGH